MGKRRDSSSKTTKKHEGPWQEIEAHVVKSVPLKSRRGGKGGRKLLDRTVAPTASGEGEINDHWHPGRGRKSVNRREGRKGLGGAGTTSRNT